MQRVAVKLVGKSLMPGGKDCHIPAPVGDEGAIRYRLLGKRVKFSRFETEYVVFRIKCVDLPAAGSMAISGKRDKTGETLCAALSCGNRASQATSAHGSISRRARAETTLTGLPFSSHRSVRTGTHRIRGPVVLARPRCCSSPFNRPYLVNEML
jgi:hypothetical protein